MTDVLPYAPAAAADAPATGVPWRLVKDINSRLEERIVYLEPVRIDPVDGASLNGDGKPTLALIHQRVPFMLKNGTPYAVLRLVVPIVLNGPLEAFRDDWYPYKHSCPVTALPTPVEKPWMAHVTIRPAQLVRAEKHMIELPDAFPQIVR